MKSEHNPFQHFLDITDYRQEGKVKHKLSDIILLTICAVISGQDGWDGIEDFGHARIDFLKRYGEFLLGVPGADTISRVMGQISPKALQESFIAWMQSCHTLTEGEVIAIDGKTARGSYNKAKAKGAIHMVNAFATRNGMSIGQVKVNAKSNEITAIPELLELLDVKGCLITIDAMGCQKKVAQKIVSKGADYLLAVKGNQGKLEAKFDEYFDVNMLQSFDGDSYSTQEKSHGRKETRLALVNNDLSVLGDLEYEWPELKTMGIVSSFRVDKDIGTEKSFSVRYYISSKVLDAETLLNSTRSHWGVEVMHWSLDTALKEDASRIRVDDRAEAFARIRQMALNLLKSETSFKGGVQRKRVRAAMNETYLSKVLEAL
jgi:predicted transposase YbfD/YdcC